MSQQPTVAERRTVNGMIGAMIVAVIVAGAWYLIGRPDESSRPTPDVEWKPQVTAARADGALLIYAPDDLPTGWHAREVRYLTGSDPSWHFAILTDKDKYVGIDEARVAVSDLVQSSVDKDATQGKDVTIAGQVWQSWTDSNGDYALTRTVREGRFDNDSVVVVGHTSPQAVQDFVATLRTGTVKLAG